MNKIQGVEFEGKHELVRNLYSKIGFHVPSIKSIDPRIKRIDGVVSSIPQQEAYSLFPTQESKILLIRGLQREVLEIKRQEAIECFDRVLQISPNN